jgi:hypothetical protein
MKPRRPLGLARPLVPVIGRGGGPQRRRGPLALLWRRLRPGQAGPPLRTRIRPLHFHPRWTFDIRLYWSLLAAPTGWRTHDRTAPPVPQRRPRRAAHDPVFRSASRLRRERPSPARAAGGPQPLLPSWRLRLVAAIPLVFGSGGPGAAPPPSGAPGKRGDGPPRVPQSRGDARRNEAGSRRLWTGRDRIRPRLPLLVAVPGQSPFRAAPARVGAVPLRAAVAPSIARPANPPRGRADLRAAGVAPARRLPRGLHAAPLTRQRAAPLAEPGGASAAGLPRARTRAGPPPTPSVPSADAAAAVTTGRARRRPRSAAERARPVAGSPAAGRTRLVRADRGTSAATTAETGTSAMRIPPVPPPHRRAAVIVHYGRLPRPGAAASRPLHPDWRKPGRRHGLSTALQPSERGSIASVARAPGRQGRRPRQTAPVGRAYGTCAPIEPPVGEAIKFLERAWRTPATIAQVVRTASARAAPVSAPARPPRRRSDRPLPLALGPNDAPPILAISGRPRRHPVARVVASSPPANAPPAAPAATKRRRQTPVVRAAARPRQDDAAAPVMRVPPASPRRTAIGLASAPRPIVESVVLPRLPPRRRAEVRSPSRVEAPMPKAGSSTGERRRIPTRAALLHSAPAPRTVGRHAPVSPAPVERPAPATPGRSLRLIYADRPATDVRRPGRRSAELLWGNRPASASTMFVGTSAQQPAAAAEQARDLVAGTPPPGAFAQPPPPDMNRLVDEVLLRLDRQARTERLRRGI